MEQASKQADFRARDIGLYDLSCRWQATHPTTPGTMRLIMLTFPRTLVPLTRADVRPLIGTVMPRSLPGRDLIAQFLIGLIDNGKPTGDPGLAGVLSECTIGLIRQRLGRPHGMTQETRRLLPYGTRPHHHPPPARRPPA